VRIRFGIFGCEFVRKTLRAVAVTPRAVRDIAERRSDLDSSQRALLGLDHMAGLASFLCKSTTRYDIAVLRLCIAPRRATVLSLAIIKSAAKLLRLLVDGHRLFYRKAGDPRRPRLLLLEGVLRSSRPYLPTDRGVELVTSGATYMNTVDNRAWQ